MSQKIHKIMKVLNLYSREATNQLLQAIENEIEFRVITETEINNHEIKFIQVALPVDKIDLSPEECRVLISEQIKDLSERLKAEKKHVIKTCKLSPLPVKFDYQVEKSGLSAYFYCAYDIYQKKDLIIMTIGISVGEKT